MREKVTGHVNHREILLTSLWCAQLSPQSQLACACVHWRVTMGQDSSVLTIDQRIDRQKETEKTGTKCSSQHSSHIVKSSTIRTLPRSVDAIMVQRLGTVLLFFFLFGSMKLERLLSLTMCMLWFRKKTPASNGWRLTLGVTAELLRHLVDLVRSTLGAVYISLLVANEHALKILKTSSFHLPVWTVKQFEAKIVDLQHDQDGLPI